MLLRISKSYLLCIFYCIPVTNRLKVVVLPRQMTHRDYIVCRLVTMAMRVISERTCPRRDTTDRREMDRDNRFVAPLLLSIADRDEWVDSFDCRRRIMQSAIFWPPINKMMIGP